MSGSAGARRAASPAPVPAAAAAAAAAELAEQVAAAQQQQATGAAGAPGGVHPAASAVGDVVVHAPLPASGVHTSGVALPSATVGTINGNVAGIMSGSVGDSAALEVVRQLLVLQTQQAATALAQQQTAHAQQAAAQAQMAAVLAAQMAQQERAAEAALAQQRRAGAGSPPTFTGTQNRGVEVYTFLGAMESWFATAHMDDVGADAERVVVAASQLRGSAQLWWHALRAQVQLGYPPPGRPSRKQSPNSTNHKRRRAGPDSSCGSCSRRTTATCRMYTRGSGSLSDAAR